jgi:NADH-quinone oxidoreductase subunit N
MSPAPALNLGTLFPIGSVWLGAVLVLLGEVLLSRRQSFLGRPVTPVWIGTVLAAISTFFLVLTLAMSLQAFLSGSALDFDPSHPMVQLDRFSNFSVVVVVLGALLSCWLSVSYLVELRINHGEYYALLLLSTSGMMLTVMAVDLVALFLGIELMSIPIYVMAGFQRRDLRSNEAALKYFLVGSFATAILLYGMALLYGVTGATDFSAIHAGLEPTNLLGLAGVGLLIVGFAFKVSSVPFHQWTPDVYEGAPTAVTAYMSVTVKAAAFLALLRVVMVALPSVALRLEPLFWGLAALTMIVGNVMAVIQDNVKRMLAYSSVAHAGYLLIGLATATAESYGAVAFYLLAYVFMNVGAFAVVSALAEAGRECDRIQEFAGLGRERPGMAALMTLFMLSLAGIPGTAGFFAKFVLFASAVQTGVTRLTVLTIVAVLASLVSVYYYLRLPVMMYMRERTAESGPWGMLSTGELVVLVTCAVGVLFLGIFPNVVDGLHVLDWARDSAAPLFAAR